MFILIYVKNQTVEALDSISKSKYKYGFVTPIESEKPKKGLNIPNSIYDNKTQEKTYLKYFKIFEKTKIDAVGLSFIQNKNIISKLKKNTRI